MLERFRCGSIGSATMPEQAKENDQKGSKLHALQCKMGMNSFPVLTERRGALRGWLSCLKHGEECSDKCVLNFVDLCFDLGGGHVHLGRLVKCSGDTLIWSGVVWQKTQAHSLTLTLLMFFFCFCLAKSCQDIGMSWVEIGKVSRPCFPV